MLGYQGANDPFATRAVARAHARADPALARVAVHLQGSHSSPDGDPQKRRAARVGFVSSYLRHHSVRVIHVSMHALASLPTPFLPLILSLSVSPPPSSFSPGWPVGGGSGVAAGFA
jgi:hypothetical protein